MTNTCIIGYINKEKKEMYMMGDSAGVSGLNITTRKDTKVFERRINGKPMLMGFTTSFRMGQILMFCDLPQYSGEDPFEYMVKRFIPCIIREFTEGKYIRSFDEDGKKDQKAGGTFLVAFEGRLFLIADDFQVGEDVELFSSVGCGASYAKASLTTMDKLGIKYSKEERMKLAMEVVAYKSGGVVEPFNLITCKYD